MSAQGRDLRLLVVDDEEKYLAVLSKRLARRRVAVTTANGGSAAFRAMRNSDFDVAVVDLKMEEMDGLEVLKFMKKMDPDLPVIILTGHGSERAAREGMDLGAYDYLVKPCELETLLAKINEAREA